MIIEINGEQRHISDYTIGKTVHTSVDFTNVNVGDIYRIYPLVRKILNYDATNNIATIDAFTSAPSTNLRYKIYRSNGFGMKVSIKKMEMMN